MSFNSKLSTGKQVFEFLKELGSSLGYTVPFVPPLLAGIKLAGQIPAVKDLLSYLEESTGWQWYRRQGTVTGMTATAALKDVLRYLPDHRKIGKSNMKPLDKPLEMILKKTAEKHVKYAQAVLAPLNFGTHVRYFLLFRFPGDTSVSFSYEDLARRRAQLVSVPLTLDIYRWYQEMLRSHAVVFDQTRASWLVFGYEEVQRVLLDPQTFSSQRAVNADGKVDPLLGAGLLGMDPPRHRHLRALISQAFTPRMVAQLEPRITAMVQALLDLVAARGEMDLVDELAFPLPILVIAELLGVPSHDRELFRAWSAEAVSPDLAHQKAAILLSSCLSLPSG